MRVACSSWMAVGIALGSLLPVAPVGAATLTLSAARVEAPGWVLRDARAEWTGGGELRASSGALAGSAVPVPLRALQLKCAPLRIDGGELACARAELQALGAAPTRLRLRGALRLRDAAYWSLEQAALDGVLTAADASGQRASEALAIELQGGVRRQGAMLHIAARARLPRGQAYVEPVFMDFEQHPLSATLRGTLDLHGARLTLDTLELDQPGLGQARLRGTHGWRADGRGTLQAELQLASLAPALELYLRPFLAGTRLEDLAGEGRAALVLELRDRGLQRAELRADEARLHSTRLGGELQGLAGVLRWQADAPAVSDLSWRAARAGSLALGASRLQLRAQGRDLELTAPLRIPGAGGALRIEQLALSGLGGEDLGARFQAEVEPIDLAALCRAFGWPEFSGQLSGRLPGLRLAERTLSLDGALEARAFDGEVRVSQLRVIEPFGVLPRITADIRLRNLDLQALTGAFSFGRIEGRLDGDIEGLRLLGWEPVAMRARLYTPPGDRSRHRISQRAIDNISSIGGGPTGVLSKGFLRFFEDFAYDRIGWSCVLADGVCRMDGLGPAPGKPDAYVLVKGKLVPRIDVIGYTRAVNWNTFLQQLQSARAAEGVEVR